LKNVTRPILFSVSPSAPELHVTPGGTSSLNLRWKARDNGGSAIRGYVLNFRRGGHAAEWEEHVLSRTLTGYTLRGLECGTDYHLYLIAVNRVGSGAPSETVVTRTEGSKPGAPQSADLISLNMSTVTLNLNKWEENGCAITSFTIEYREKSQDDWITGTSTKKL
jgi:Down syndrome cell adhesion protein